MANPLLTLAPNAEGMPNAAKFGGVSTVNQSVVEGGHPFAHLLAEQTPAAAGGAAVTTATVPDELAGNPAVQNLPLDGNALPGEVLLAGLTGRPLESGAVAAPAAADEVAGDLAAQLLPAAADTEIAPADVEVVDQVVAEDLTVDIAADAAEVVAVAVAAPQQVAEAEPVAGDAAATVVRQSLAARVPVAAARVAEAQPGGAEADGAQLPLPSHASDTAQNVTAAVQLALAQRRAAAGRAQGVGEAVKAVANAGSAAVDNSAQSASPLNTAGVMPAAASQSQAATGPQLAQPQTSVMTPFNQPGWDEAVGERVQWMVGQKLQGAEIRLNPAHLGPMEVRVSVQNDQAHIAFTAQHGVVREALEAALPRLREMLSESGLSLGDVNVSDQSFAEQRRDGGSESAGSPHPSFVQEMGGEDEPHATRITALREGGGGIDLFA